METTVHNTPNTVTVLPSTKIEYLDDDDIVEYRRKSNKLSAESGLKKSSIDKDGEKKEYINHINKLPSIGPLDIQNLDEFLEASKKDFEMQYRDKTISKLTIADFRILKRIGNGAFGTVLLAELRSDESMYAIKVYDKMKVLNKKYIRYVTNEKRVLQGLNFPFLVYLKNFFLDKHFLFFVMPYISGGTFYRHLLKHKKFNEESGQFYTSQLVLALEYLHYMEVVHRDVKLENILIDQFGYLKLADFGQCKRLHGAGDKCWTFTGTPEYMSPEVINSSGYDYSVDWWSLGVVTYIVCSGHYPFKHKNQHKLFKLIKHVKYTCPQDFSEPLKNFLAELLVNYSSADKTSDNRRSIHLKSHPWLNKIDWFSILNRSISAPCIPDIKELDITREK